MIGRLKRKHIENFLQNTPDFEALEKDKWNYEQHLTPPLIAAECLHRIYQMDDVENSNACDLGCGTGMLMQGLLFMGAKFVLGVDKDKKYLDITRGVIEEKFDGEVKFELIESDILKWDSKKFDNFFEMVVMNPPFGTKIEGIDYVFLQKAFEVCNGNVYSFHKSESRKVLEKKAKENNKKFEVLLEIDFPINRRFAKYHKLDSKGVAVDLICFSNI